MIDTEEKDIVWKSHGDALQGLIALHRDGPHRFRNGRMNKVHHLLGRSGGRRG